MRVFIEFLLLTTYNAYILERDKIPHKCRGKRFAKVHARPGCAACGNHSCQNKGSQEAKTKCASWRSSVECWPHLPLKAEGNDHQCVVGEERYTKAKKNGETFKRQKTSYKGEQQNVYLYIRLPGESCFAVDYHTKIVYLSWTWRLFQPPFSFLEWGLWLFCFYNYSNKQCFWAEVYFQRILPHLKMHGDCIQTTIFFHLRWTFNSYMLFTLYLVRTVKTTSQFNDILLSLKVDMSFFIDILHWCDIYKSIIQTYKNKYCGKQ